MRSLGGGIWEIRSNLAQGRIARVLFCRVLFCIEGQCIVLLHAFMKKSQKTPKQDLNLAIQRKKAGRP